MWLQELQTLELLVSSGSQGSSSFFSDASDNNLSLFGLSGFSRKLPAAGVVVNGRTVSAPAAGATEQSAAAPAAASLATSQQHATALSNSSVGVSSPTTDWSAAFGFKSAAVPSSIPQTAEPLKAAQAPPTTPNTHPSVDSAADDDLGECSLQRRRLWPTSHRSASFSVGCLSLLYTCLLVCGTLMFNSFISFMCVGTGYVLAIYIYPHFTDT